MSNLINEEINRIREIMYGPINEDRATTLKKFFGGIDDALTKANLTDDAVKARLLDLQNTVPDEIFAKAKQYKREIKSEANALKAEIAKINNSKKYTDEVKKSKIQELEKQIKNKKKGIKEIDKRLNQYSGYLEGEAQAGLNVAKPPAPKAPTAKKPRAKKDATKKPDAEKPAAAKPDTPEQPKVTPEQTSTTLPTGEVIPHPPMNQPSKFSAWLKNRFVSTIAKYAVLFGAGAVGLGFLIKWLLSSPDKNKNCMGKLLEERRDKVFLRQPSTRRKSAYYLVIPDNPAISNEIKKIILEDRGGRFKALNAETKQEIGGWKFGDDCTLYLVYGTQDIPMFTSTASTPTPSPAPSPGQGRYRRCSGTYKKGCVSPKIAQLQACLRITPDQKWWDKTEQAVVAKFRKNVLTDAEIDQFCRSQSTPQPAPQPVTPPQPQQPTEVPQTEEF
jgi:hypothetical protein